jgi:Transposase DDE domain group 1
MLAVWAEMDAVLADEFRDGNVPAQMAPLTVAKAAFAALPKTVSSYYYRGDSACHEKELVRWLSNERREEGPQGCIGFAISVRMSEALREAILEVPEKAWQGYGEPEPGIDRECAEVVFVSNQQAELKDSQPLRYIAIRLRQRQGGLFADGSSVRHFAVLSNIWDWEAVKLIEWHREKAGTIERVHDVMKNDLAAGVLPSKYFGANAAWLRLAVISYNVLTALKRLALPANLLTARPKRLRFLIFHTPGRLVHHARQLSLRLGTAIAELALCLDAVRLLPLPS